jgi:hypothetical protein
MEVVRCDEFPGGFGWIVAGERLERASHALVADGSVWVIDPVEGDGVEERIHAAGTPAGVIQLLDRHSRDCRPFAARVGVRHHVVPFEDVAGAPFRFIRVVAFPGWREVALWWPEQRVLCVADVLGTANYFRARGERLAVHPFLRPWPPRALRDLARRLTPGHVLCGHGEGMHGDEAAFALEEALSTARRRIPRWLAHQVRWRR